MRDRNFQGIEIDQELLHRVILQKRNPQLYHQLEENGVYFNSKDFIAGIEYINKDYFKYAN